MAKAQSQSHLNYCLQAAHKVEVQQFSIFKMYFAEEAKMQSLLPASCSSLRFEIFLHGKKDFRIVSEEGKEMWAIDQDYVLSKVGKAAAAAVTGTAHTVATAVVKVPTNSPTPAYAKVDALFSTDLGKRKPAAVVDATAAPLAAAVSAPAPSGYSIAPSEPTAPLDHCLLRNFYGTEACTATLSALKTSCGPGSSSNTEACVHYQTVIYGTHLKECDKDQDNWGRCDMRIKMLEKKCHNQMQYATPECHELASHFAKLGMPLAWAINYDYDEDEAVDGDHASRFVENPAPITRVPASAEMESRKLKARDIAHTISQGIHELVDMYQTTEDEQRDLTYRLQDIDRDNQVIRQQNGKLKKLFDQQVMEIQSIKAGLSLRSSH